MSDTLQNSDTDTQEYQNEATQEIGDDMMMDENLKANNGQDSLLRSGRRSSLSSASQPSSSDAYSETCSDGIHAFVFYIVTKPKASSCSILGCLALSWLVVTWQCLIFGFIVGESGKPHCNLDDDCRSGQVCDYDGFCTDQDENVNCPFLVENQPQNWSVRVGIIFIFFYIVGFILEDMDQNSRITRAATYRLKHLRLTRSQRRCQCQRQQGVASCLHRKLLLEVVLPFNIWAIYYIRASVVPFATFAGTIAIIYAEDKVTTQGVILNGLAMSVVSAFDDALYTLLIRPRLRNRADWSIRSAYQKSLVVVSHDDNNDNDDDNGDNHNIDNANNYPSEPKEEIITWYMHRLVSLVFTSISCWIIFHPIEAIHLAPPIFMENSSFLNDTLISSCDNFMNAIAAWPYLLMVIFAAIDKVIIRSLSSSSSSYCSILRDALLRPIFLTIYWFLLMIFMLLIFTSY